MHKVATHTARVQAKPHLFGLSLGALQAHLKTLGLPAFRAKQLFDWVYKKGVWDWAQMTNLSATDRATLANHLDLTPLGMKVEQVARDGTTKWLFTLADGHEVETVFIPEANRGTLCISSQVGCTLNCRFCHTGTQALARNLTAAEILGQVMLARRQLNDWPAQDEGRKLTNIVLMGMGEPLFNYDNVRDAMQLAMDPAGLGYGTRKITLSTSGVVPEIARVGADLGIQLAISLHAPDDETRTKIMPINNKWPVGELMAALRAYPLKEYRRITFEYVMLKGVNDTDAHADALIKLVHGLPCKFNLIPFNPWPGAPFTCSDDARIEAFAARLSAAGLDAPVRKTRGEDILAACGQLRSESSQRNTVSLEFPSVVRVYGTPAQRARLGEKVSVEFVEE